MTRLLGVALAVGLSAIAASPVPRQTQEFKLQNSAGKQVMLTAQKGNVVVIQFLYTTCSHCQNTARWLSRMQEDLGPKGLRIYGVAFNDGVSTKDIKEFSEYAKFPVIPSPEAAVLTYLGLSIMEGYSVPQLVVIDKKGVVRAQTKPRPAAGEIADEPMMRSLVNKLLAEK